MPSINFVKPDWLVRKSKLAVQPRLFWPQQSGEARARANAASHPVKPPQSLSLARKLALRCLLRALTLGQPAASALTL